MVDLPREDASFIKEKVIEGWSPEMIGYELRENGSMLTDDTVEEYLAQERVQEEIELQRRIQEKRQEVSRDDLIRELRDQMDYISEKREELEGQDEEISSEQTKNLLKAIRQLAEMIDVLEAKDGGSADNVVNINRLQQNFDITSTVEYLPPEDKRSVAEQLAEDPDVEDFVVVTGEE